MRSRSDFMLAMIEEYKATGNPWPASLKIVARWAIDNRRWAPQPETIVNQCAEQMARALAAEYFTDDNGNRVRANHAVVHPEGPIQHVLWDDIRTAPHKHIELALQQRRQHILAECKQLKTDTDYYNTNRQPVNPFQMVFDFTRDLEEWELMKKKRAA